MRLPFSARLSVAVRGGLGSRTLGVGARPAATLELYEFEGCPFCRKVREAISALDLEVRVYPCPKGGTRYRPRAIALAGRASFPTLVDPNSPEGQRVLQESDHIVAALFDRYGTTPPPRLLQMGALGNALSGLSSGLRPFGGRRRPSIVDDADDVEPSLVLYAAEGRADARAIKEQLSELELTYLWRPTPIGSVHGDGLRLVDGDVTVIGDAIPAHLLRHGAAR